jgi:hypothetical protein
MGPERRLQTICGAIVGVAAISVLASAVADTQSRGASMPIVLAQAGSVGGTIGKQGKSVSGGEKRRSAALDAAADRSANRNTNKKEFFPKTIQLNEHGLGGNYFVTLHSVGGNAYEGTCEGT